MLQPLERGNFIDWSHYLHHRFFFRAEESVEQVYQEMLRHGITFAPVVTEERVPIGLICLKRLSAALSARYGQALFAKKAVGETRLPGSVLKQGREVADLPQNLLLPLEKITVVTPAIHFFDAQARWQRREPEEAFDDILVLSEEGTYDGMISMHAFIRLQMDVLGWQENELRRGNRELSQTLHQLSQTQTELVNSAKMAALGELVAGIAHEMNTPLGILISSHDTIEKVFNLLDPGVPEERRRQLMNLLRTNIELGREASERVTQIIRSLRTFGREDKEELHPANLADLINSTLILLAHKFQSAITVHLDLAPGATLDCYPGQISQVLVNILTNAGQAMQGRGDIYVELFRGRENWELTIRDTGPGISPHLLERVFDPGYTTKGVGVGTGLGLSISRKIVELNHGGKIRAENHHQGGAVFRLEFPIRQQRKELKELSVAGNRPVSVS